MNQQQEASIAPFEYYFKEEQIKLTAKVEVPIIPQVQQITYQILQNEQTGHQIHFSNGDTYGLHVDQENNWYWYQGESNGLLNDKIAELGATQADQQQQQHQQQENTQHLIIDIVDVTRKQNFSGSITEAQVSETTNEQEDLETILEFIQNNVVTALNSNNPFYLKLEKDICQITVRILQETKKKNAPKKEFLIQIPMIKQDVNEQVIENIKEKTLQEKINEQISQVEQQVEKLRQTVEQPNPKILEHEQKIADSEQALNYTQQKIQQTDQYLQQVANQLQDLVNENYAQQIARQESAISQQANEITSLKEQLDSSNKLSQYLQDFINQVGQQINQQQTQIQKLQDQLAQLTYKPQPQLVQLNSFLQQQQDVVQGNLYLTPIQNNNLTELQFSIDDEDAEYSIGILEEGQLENLDKKVRAFLFDFPDGKLTRGAEDALRFLPRQILRNDKFGIKVDRSQSKLIVSLNGQELPPVNLKEDFGPFAFVFTSQKELKDVFSLDESN